MIDRKNDSSRKERRLLQINLRALASFPGLLPPARHLSVDQAFIYYALRYPTMTSSITQNSANGNKSPENAVDAEQ